MDEVFERCIHCNKLSIVVTIVSMENGKQKRQGPFCLTCSKEIIGEHKEECKDR